MEFGITLYVRSDSAVPRH